MGFLDFLQNPGTLGALSGLMGFIQARDAGRPQTSEQNTVREPWAPAAGQLQDILNEAPGIYQHQANYRPPPTFQGGGGASRSALRDLAERILGRADSDFVPRAQEMALQMASGPNPLLSSAFDRASSFSSPRPDSSWNSPLTRLAEMYSGGGGGGPMSLIAQLAQQHFGGSRPGSVFSPSLGGEPAVTPQQFQFSPGGGGGNAGSYPMPSFKPKLPMPPGMGGGGGIGGNPSVAGIPPTMGSASPLPVIDFYPRPGGPVNA